MNPAVLVFYSKKKNDIFVHKFFFSSCIAKDTDLSHLIYSLRDVSRAPIFCFIDQSVGVSQIPNVAWIVMPEILYMDTQILRTLLLSKALKHGLRDKMRSILFVFSPLNFRLKEQKTKLG